MWIWSSNLWHSPWNCQNPIPLPNHWSVWWVLSSQGHYPPAYAVQYMKSAICRRLVCYSSWCLCSSLCLCNFQLVRFQCLYLSLQTHAWVLNNAPVHEPVWHWCLQNHRCILCIRDLRLYIWMTLGWYRNCWWIHSIQKTNHLLHPLNHLLRDSRFVCKVGCWCQALCCCLLSSWSYTPWRWCIHSGSI